MSLFDLYSMDDFEFTEVNDVGAAADHLLGGFASGLTAWNGWPDDDYPHVLDDDVDEYVWSAEARFGVAGVEGADPILVPQGLDLSELVESDGAVVIR